MVTFAQKMGIWGEGGAICGITPQRRHRGHRRRLRWRGVAGNNRQADTGPRLRIVAAFAVDVSRAQSYFSPHDEAL